ncbi:tripartite tricarboxylate transporter permease [Marinobacterium mangrovicola]|uniref:Putative tricarboxylic transport membrane protein n=1 Tax=Marinobacterium mangrovicola TaxID=1476959 RepID=A0A4R1GMY8_9GAMM|nr:tripartite tricarboxylate transporter permease [Marinobacterium mangrovicola]TCK05772.1 putative tricarboxylic transport membrane protein [Marinobacterium mangrovicola]
MDNVLIALSNLASIDAVITLLIGTLAGMMIGMLPGLSSTMGVALCIPITFNMPPELALILLGAVYVSSVYGGSITAILLRTPGTDASIATALDGYPLASKGRGSEAIGMATLSSLFGGTVSVIILIAVAPLLSKIALAFGPQEYALLAIFGLVTIIGVVSDNPAKGLVAALAGLALGLVGLDSFTGVPRFTFGHSELFDGVPLLPVLIGLFSVSQAFNLCIPAEAGVLKKDSIVNVHGHLPLISDIKRCFRSMARSSLIGTFIGALPGAGTSIAAFISYNEARRKSKNPENFGKGELEGIAASESANNAVTGGTLIPTLTLGIPGNAVTAVFVGGLTIHGMIPGPDLFTNFADITYTLLISLLIANVLFAVMGIALSKYLVNVTKIPGSILGPIILIFSIVGTYALRNELFDVWLAAAFGLIGYFMERWKYPTAPLVIALILGPILEVNFRRSMQISNWDYSTFFDSYLSLAIISLVVLSVAYPLCKAWQKNR